MHSTVTFLGTGPSPGVPVIGCPCEICRSKDPRNMRTRSALHLRTPELSLLVDFGPDLRIQALREELTRVDAVLLTHTHLDHIAGFDELRAFCWHRESPLPIHASPDSIETLQRMFPWAFEDHGYRGYIRPDPIAFDGPFHIADLGITPLLVEHGGVTTHGFRFEFPGQAGSLAFISDVKSIPDATLPLMQDLDVLVIDALREKRHNTHMSIGEALAATDDVAPRKTFLTHLSHEVDYEHTCAKLPTGVSLAHDGLKLHFRPGRT